MSDPALQSRIMEALAASPVVHPDEISVEVRSGYAIMRGTVGTPLQRKEAERTARDVPGVKLVANELDVHLMGTGGRIDADTRAAVLDALIADGQINLSEIDVDVDDGAATLRGHVGGDAQRDRVEQLVLQVAGVATVQNELRIPGTVSADEVTARVNAAIVADGSAGSHDIRIGVTENDVTVAGVVGSYAQRDAALAAAAGVPGVAHVHDELMFSWS